MTALPQIQTKPVELYNEYLEKSILGSFMLDYAIGAEMIPTLTPEMFFFTPHKIIFTAMKKMIERGDEGIDMVSLADQLRTEKNLDVVGGHIGLANLEQIVMAPAAAYELIDRLRSMHVSRSLRDRLDDCLRSIDQGVDPHDVLSLLGDFTTGLHSSNAQWMEQEAPAPLEVVPAANLPEFPIDLLPTWMSNYCREIALTCQVYPCMPAHLSVGMLSAAMAHKVTIKIGGNWWENSACLYNLIIADASEKKGPAFSNLMAPLFRRQDSLGRENADQRVAMQVQREALEEEEKQLKKARRSGDPSVGDRLKELKSLLSSMSLPSTDFILQDATAEAMFDVLSSNHGYGVLADSEGTVFGNIIGGRYSNAGAAPNVDIMLKAYPNEVYVKSRVSKEKGSTMIKRPVLTTIMTVQPTVLLAANKKSDDKGFFARFLYSYPSSLGSRTNPNPPRIDSDSAKEAYNYNMDRLFEWDKADPDGKLPVIRFSPKGETIIREYLGRNIKRRHDDGDLAPVTYWAGKAHGHCARLAVLLQAAERGASHFGEAFHVEPDTVERAVYMMESYFTPHAQYAYNATGSEKTDLASDAKRIVRWMIRSGRTNFTERSIHRGTHGGMNSDRRDAALAWLVKRGWLSQNLPKGVLAQTGRPKGPSYDLNPVAATQPL
jgi:hypothetical protein